MRGVFVCAIGDSCGRDLSGSTEVTKNSTFTFTASVTGENDYSSEVVWSISGQTSQSTFIDSKGVLNVAADEGATSIMVKAVSRQDSAYSATALATIKNASYRVNISVNDGNGGTATEGKTVNAGENMTIKATPKDGWRFVEWRENDKSISNNQEFTLENITGDRNLTAVFEKEPPKTYTVAAAVATNGGIITPTGMSPVPAGSWIGYAITPTGDIACAWYMWTERQSVRPLPTILPMCRRIIPSRRSLSRILRSRRQT